MYRFDRAYVITPPDEKTTANIELEIEEENYEEEDERVKAEIIKDHLSDENRKIEKGYMVEMSYLYFLKTEKSDVESFQVLFEKDEIDDDQRTLLAAGRMVEEYIDHVYKGEV